MAYKSSCKTLRKVGESEPIFVLRAQDLSAPQTILHWLELNQHVSDEKFNEAMNCVQAMRAWPKRKATD